MYSKTKTDKGFKMAQGTTYPLHKRLFDLREAAHYLGRPVFSVRTLIWQGSLPVVKEGRKMYLDILDLDEYVNRNKMTLA